MNFTLPAFDFAGLWEAIKAFNFAGAWEIIKAFFAGLFA